MTLSCVRDLKFIRDNVVMIPPVSPFGLIQETLWPDEWRILVACIMLNLTTRRAVEKILPKLFDRYPDALAMSSASFDDLSQDIAPLGFRNRRAKNLINMSRQYVKGEWTHASELPGIGEYAASAWSIFVLGIMPSECPRDGALAKYYKWRKLNGL